MISINKPKFDPRTFYGGQLDNHIKYVLVNDEHLEKSYVSVCVNIGSFANPTDYNGLAHFLEHMLFMGSEKYPNENHYSTRLNELGGYSNAYTDTTKTVYYFNVFNNGLAEIFDIFSRFFIDPLFKPDSINREINAVNSEHRKNINNDFWKIFQLSLYLSNNDSVTNTFITGSLNSLDKPDIRNKMIEFYNKYYKPNNISICIASSKPINELKDIITNTFGNIPNNNPAPSFLINKPFYDQNRTKSYHLKTLSNIHKIIYIWEIPYQDLYNYSHDFDILGNIISNKSEESLFFKLKSMGYLNDINFEIKYEGVFSITLSLTEEGFNNIDYIESMLFSYLNFIYTLNLKKFAEYYQKISLISFDCLKKFDTEDLCNHLAVNHYYYQTMYIFDSIIIREIKSTQTYSNLFSQYINQNNYIKIIASQDYNTNNNYIPLREYTETLWTQVNSNPNIDINIQQFKTIDIENDYLDINMELISNLDNFNVPTLISEKQWYGGISKFGEPLVNIYLQFNNNKYFNNPENYILTNICCSILNFMVSVYLNKPFELCYSINFSVNVSNSSIIITVKAINDIIKLNLLINQFSNFLSNIKNEFEHISDLFINNLIVSYKNSYNNTNFLNPWEYSSFLVKDDVYDNEYSVSELLNALDNIDYNIIKNYLFDLFTNSTLTTMTYGNIRVTDITNLYSKFNKMFYNNNYPLPTINSLNNSSIIHPNIKEKSNCVTYYYYIGKFIPKQNVLMLLTVNILSQKFFDELRTKRQLGYLVRMAISGFRDDYYIIQKIQSEKSVNEVRSYIDEFNRMRIKYIFDSNFNEFVKSLKDQLLEPENSIDEKCARYLPEISNRYYLFNRKELLLRSLEQVNINDLINFVKTFINKTNRVVKIVNGN